MARSEPYRESLDVDARWDWQRGRWVPTEEARRALDAFISEALEHVALQDREAWRERSPVTAHVTVSARVPKERT